MDKQQIINYFIERGILISPDLLEGEINEEKLIELFKGAGLPVLNKDLLDSVETKENVEDINWTDFDSSRVDKESGVENKIYDSFLQSISPIKDAAEAEEEKAILPVEVKESSTREGNVSIVFNYEDQVNKKEVKDFVLHFRSRYDRLKKILVLRSELQDSISIAKLQGKKEGERMSIIGFVVDKRKTKNGHWIVELEDTTGRTNVLFSIKNKELLDAAEDLVLDEVIGVSGSTGKGIVFSNAVYFPDIPISHELKKSPEEAYAAFISDVQVGSKHFLPEDFLKFVKWLGGEYGDEEQRELGRKVKYVFVVGDAVEGVGIYPGQELDLILPDACEQYTEFARFLKMIPKDVKIIICGGNHDPMRIAEPQPVLDRKYAAALYEMPNVIMVTNPSMVNIHSSENFEGFDVLLYHGWSLIYYSDAVASLRAKGGMDQVQLVMEFLLQKRHLCPTHTANLYVPDNRGDPLIISKVPDIFVTGHIHRVRVSNYRNVTNINCGCWTSQSENEEKRGIIPEPAKVPVMNLSTRKVKIMNFFGGDEIAGK